MLKGGSWAKCAPAPSTTRVFPDPLEIPSPGRNPSQAAKDTSPGLHDREAKAFHGALALSSHQFLFFPPFFPCRATCLSLSRSSPRPRPTMSSAPRPRPLSSQTLASSTASRARHRRALWAGPSILLCRARSSAVRTHWSWAGSLQPRPSACALSSSPFVGACGRAALGAPSPPPPIAIFLSVSHAFLPTRSPSCAW